MLRIEDVPAPVPADDELLVRVRATTVNQTDCHVRRAEPIPWRFRIGVFRPKWTTLGMEFAGEVEAVGSAVAEFGVGDRVFGMKNHGANAELVTVRESRLVAHLPDALSFEEGAAVIDGAYQGLFALRRGRVGKGTRLLVYGASGSCGTACVQLGRHLGAHVTAVCGTKNVELVRSLGADVVIDYQREDFRKRGEKYDVIVDAVGKIVGLRYRGSLVPGGMFVLTDGFMERAGRPPDPLEQPEDRRGVAAVREGGSPLPQAAARDRRVPRRDRPHLPARGRGRGAPVRGHLAEDRQRRSHGRRERGSERMRAVVHDRYGPPEVLRIEDVPRPVPDGRRGARQGARDVGHPDRLRRSARAEPFFSRVFTGVFRPKRTDRSGWSSPERSRRSAQR